MFRVKICGITLRRDFVLASKLGADAVGFNFFRGSKRYLEIGKCRDLIGKIPAGLNLVGVFVNETPDAINRAAELTGVTWVQLSGDEVEKHVKKIERKTIKVIRPKSADDVKEAEDFPSDGIMFDTSVHGEFGGTGQTFDYDVIIAAEIKRPFLLAGGLTPDNVSHIIKKVQPFGVDVATGVELSPGEKDPERMREFINKSKEALKHCQDTRGK